MIAPFCTVCSHFLLACYLFALRTQGYPRFKRTVQYIVGCRAVVWGSSAPCITPLSSTVTTLPYGIDGYAVCSSHNLSYLTFSLVLQCGDDYSRDHFLLRGPFPTPVNYQLKMTTVSWRCPFCSPVQHHTSKTRCLYYFKMRANQD